jgi:S1-C subfamily serine protease
MADTSDWEFPSDLQPNAGDYGFDLERTLDSMVLLRAEIPEDAFTAPNLGTERVGNGIVIREDGIILTIGYIITEASAIWLTTNKGGVVPAYALAYDQESGFGLVQALGRLQAPAIARGSAAGCDVGDPVLVAGHGGRSHALKAKVIGKREFAGSWEYLLDEAIFTAPAHPQWGGSALIGEDGRLLGVGSLLVQESVAGNKGMESGSDGAVQGNMMVPIDLIEPILDDLLLLGRPKGPARPWLGMYANEMSGRLLVAGLAKGGPAQRAAVQVGDVVTEVAGEKVAGLADLFRKVWKLGPAGTEVPLTLARRGSVQQVRVRSGDRHDFLKKPHVH